MLGDGGNMTDPQVSGLGDLTNNALSPLQNGDRAYQKNPIWEWTWGGLSLKIPFSLTFTLAVF